MWDKIHKIISDRKKEMDVDLPDAALWDKIEDKLDQGSRKKSNYGWLKIAAVLLIMASVAFYFFQEKPSGDTETASNKVSIEEPYPEIAQAEMFYLASVQSLQMQIEASEVPQDSSQIHYLKVLDSTYVDLKELLAEDVNRDQIIAEMINNLQMRISILQKQLMLVKEFEKRLKQQENEKALI